MKRVVRLSGRPRSSPSIELDSSDVVAILAALAQPWRLATFRLLTRYLPYGLAAGDIARLIALSHNTLSTHLAILEQAGLIRSRREGRSIIFVAVRERALQLAAFLGDDCTGSSELASSPSDMSASNPFPTKREVAAPDKPYNVLILCTGNSARSILAEALLNKEGQGRFRAYSAGSNPKSRPSPHALALLRELGYDVAGLRSKSWEKFAGPNAPRMDFILTVCDAAAGAPCPYWPGHPLVAHWGIPDPAAVRGTDAEKRAAFVEAYRHLAFRITTFVNLDVEKLDLSTLQRKLVDIGGMEGATQMALQRKAA
jgi:ArsR family transcriptional regulator, arsenate/arsenite/antimonite-responsive transcriptional repressor / arsenate reductase (thioredoxin)